MAEILTQAEIDALIASLMAEEAKQPQGGAPPAEAAAHRRLRLYDFRRPDKFSKDQLRSLQVIHENFARLLTTFFTASFRTVVQIVIGSVDQGTYGEFIRAVNNPSVLCPFRLPPLDGTCVLDVSPVVAFPMIDRMFGGPGSSLPKARELTDIEQTVMMRIIRGILRALQEAWENLVAVEPEPLGIENNPIFVQVASANEIVVTVAVDVRVGEHVGVITLCFPYVTLEPILDRLTSHNWFGTGPRQPTAADRQALEKRLARTRVPVTVELGRAELTVRELLDLAVGDVVVLDRRVGEACTVFVGDQPKFTAVPGTVRGRLAAQVRARLPGEEPQEDER
ncbi:flagellar motor switch protein FliM [Caldinitratiruptor microaerophilus]|uniref:Flagellar motor switch protein FliM n=1 Tax=Caldinitratiruptor microaerophilus TaxID=671077 RepID=A0AA35CJ81_9FIRM|nr:flagellar motor switch protein FliM [Caldinitratiruptor microaerophilus]BDG59363.1 flagellar motor switch protein FliM [Caldinitratiruptor microaerophilus]